MTNSFAKPFEGKAVLITGGTKGLGLETAQLFARQGAKRVLVTYRSDSESAKRAVEIIKRAGAEDAHAIACDLSESDSMAKLFSAIREKAKTLDVYVHNAAATAFKPLLEIKSHHVDKTFNITVKGFILALAELVTLMPEGGAIVTVSGLDTKKAVPRHGLLGAAKSALETLTAYAAHELAPKKIRVNGINPGFLETESTRIYLGPQIDHVIGQFSRVVPLKRKASLEEVAQVIAFLASPASNWIVGQTINVDGGQDFALPS